MLCHASVKESSPAGSQLRISTAAVSHETYSRFSYISSWQEDKTAVPALASPQLVITEDYRPDYIWQSASQAFPLHVGPLAGSSIIPDPTENHGLLFPDGCLPCNFGIR
jgi:hypothetical protein